MKKLLMFLVLLTVSVGTWAVEWTNRPSSVTITEEDNGETLVITSTNSAEFQTFWAANIANANEGNYKKIKYVGQFGSFSYLQGGVTGNGTIDQLTIPVMDVTGVTDIYDVQVLTNPNVTTVIYNGGGSIATVTDNSTGSDVILVDKNNKTATAKLSGSDELASAMPQIDVALDRLTITGTLSSDDAAVLNATAVDASGVTTVTAELEEIKGTATYMALPAGYSTADLESLKTYNPNLQVAMGFEDLNTNKPKLTMHSFSSNNVVNAANALNNFANIRACKYVSMTGNYGDHDLVDGTSLNFGDVAVWDFTGASFDNCNVDASVCDGGPYYASNDPFCLNGTLTLSNSYPSNAFYYFKNYSTKVVEIQLPTGITELPPACMNRLGEENGPNYKLIKGLTDTEFTAANSQYSYIAGYVAGQWMPIDKLVIPDNIKTVGYEACRQSVLKSVVLGSGVEEVQGGAFKLNRLIESVDCTPGINNCYLGDQAFNECNNMKHIQLSEGIVSLGANCFNNSQNLESIRLPETLLYIGNLCFKDGHALSSIIIPENVEKIGKQAFALTALKDIYLTTTDPAKVPEIWTGGEGFKDGNSTFSVNEMYGNNSCPWGRSELTDPVNYGQTPEPNNYGFGSMTWDEVVDYYYTHCNLIGVLHFPSELAGKVRADLVQQYAFRCEVDGQGNGIGVPDQIDATKLRGGLAANLDSQNNNYGKYTSDGWAQFALMKEYVPNHDVVFTKEYDDVWYTMCFPFDLTDEQLASAFNETFNIVDFSGVEIRDEENGKKNLVLHFNNVAETTYKDESGTEYVRKRTNGLTGDVVRERDGDFDYNVYYEVDKTTNQPITTYEFHHVQAKGNGDTSQYKTKNFGKFPSSQTSDFTIDNSVDKEVFMIDGYLASAGHPYMIHPSTGTKIGSPKVRCHFAGITWKKEDTGGGYESLYNAQARTVDLGGEIVNGAYTGNPYTENNFNQAAYSEYKGQTYTFKGNWREVSADAPAKPTIENGGLEDYDPYPTLASHPDLEQYLGELYQYYPNGPTKAVQGPEPQPSDFFDVNEIGARMTEADKPETVNNPDEKTDDEGNLVYTEAFRTLYNTVRCHVYLGYIEGVHRYRDYTYGEDLVEYTMSDFFTNWNGYAYATRSDRHNENCNYQELETYLGSASQSDIESKFAALKKLAEDYNTDKAAYNQNQTDLAHYNANVAAWALYDAAWNEWNSFSETQAETDYQTALTAYNTALGNWQDACDDVDDSNDDLISDWEDDCAEIDRNNEAALAAWEASVENYKVLIPQYAYFLARPSSSAFPKYYREMADDSTPRTTGIWNQYTAIVIPNDAALSGIEETTTSSGSVKNYNIAFNEDYEGEFDPTEIKDIVAKAEEKGQKVEYMNIVYSINGEIVGHGSSSLNNLPKGMYIINGKKYLVK